MGTSHWSAVGNSYISEIFGPSRQLLCGCVLFLCTPYFFWYNSPLPETVALIFWVFPFAVQVSSYHNALGSPTWDICMCMCMQASAGIRCFVKRCTSYVIKFYVLLVMFLCRAIILLKKLMRQERMFNPTNFLCKCADRCHCIRIKLLTIHR